MTRPNYITPSGFKKLKEELRHLLHGERPQVVKTVSWAAANGDRSENADYIYGKRRLREIDRRIQFLQKRLEAVEVVDSLKSAQETIGFGATVTVRDEDGVKATYKIVGEDEFDVSQGRISWRSPLAQSLIGHRVGDFVILQRPKGKIEIEIMGVEYR